MKKLFLAVMLIASSLALAGCVKMNYGLKINMDGSGELSFLVAMQQQLAAMSGSSMKEAKVEASKEGYEITNYKKDQMVGFVAKKQFDDVNELTAKDMIYGGEDKSKNDNNDFDLNVKKGLLFTTYRVNGQFDFTNMTEETEENEMFDQEMQQSFLDQMDLSFKLTLPIKPDKEDHNATLTEDDGKTLVWEFIPNEINDVKLAVKVPNLVNIGLLLAGAAALIIGLIVVARKKKRV
ncbi:hypothetical protein JOC78_000712 [Bacillus ectoiniformans]|uniref:DUF3153 domain-containing protein n=1 Tax=Bacillus ectoiniformans TaxID=1494429 RepID=UPI0019575DC5|nr:DUF3153 domain-containing protein [Bacillus ectoiniformans]MBM7647772.1 hypothetical protein [Bacillus ectoiniformans]